MYSSGAASDEPTRLEQIVASTFRYSNFIAETAGGGRARLVAGVESQDDCAVYRFDGPQELVVGTDYVRGPKFRLYEFGLLDEYDLGYYLVAANLSDIAAMGAQPIGFLSVVRYPSDMNDEAFQRVLAGIRDACAACHTPVVGGDIGSAERLILSGSAIGVCDAGGALMRSGARAGDSLYLSGPTGTAGAAMAYFRLNEPDEVIEARFRSTLLRSWARPQARTDVGRFLGRSGMVTSCQDSSDGLKAAIESICTASKCGAIVKEESVPIPEEVALVSRATGKDPLNLVFGDSVDFQLIFSVPDETTDKFEKSAAENGYTFSRIGELTPSTDVLLQTSSGSFVELPGEAWRHAPEPGTGSTVA